MLVTAATAISIMIVTGNNRLTYGCTEVSGLTNRLEHPFSFCGELQSIHTAGKTAYFGNTNRGETKQLVSS